MTVVLIAAGFIALMEVLGTGLAAGSYNEAEVIAAGLAQEKMEFIRNTPFPAIAGEVKAPVPGFASFQRETAVDMPRQNLKRVTVKVYWCAKGAEMTSTLVTYVSNI